MDQSRIKLVGAIVMALSMPSIWQTRSSFASAQVDQKDSAPVEKGSVQKAPRESGPQESTPPNSVPSEKEPSNAPTGTPGSPTLDNPAVDKSTAPLSGIVDKSEAPPLSAIIEKQEIELKPGRALTDSEQRQLLIGEALARHGSPGLFIASFMKGPWTIDRPLIGSSAERAGLKPGDVIVSIDGKKISGETGVRDVYLTMCGSRGQYRSFVVKRGDHHYTIVVPLWGINDMRNRRTQYIEYYWYLLYHNMISVKQYHQAVKSFDYLKVPVRYSKVPVRKKPSISRSGRNKGKSR